MFQHRKQQPELHYLKCPGTSRRSSLTCQNLFLYSLSPPSFLLCFAFSYRLLDEGQLHHAQKRAGVRDVFQRRELQLSLALPRKSTVPKALPQELPELPGFISG